MIKGVFWLIDEELLAFPFDSSYPEGIAKSGDTYNHKKLWKCVQSKGYRYSFDYYPRGRVDINNKGIAVIYMSPHINERYVEIIKHDFGISGNCIVRYDYSEHYHCYLDKDGI
ncbi:MAG: hypothetical protein ACI4WH_08065 [Oscillospiraceae bacterium]